MATEKLANLAREEHSDYLRGLGAHGIAVGKVERTEGPTFAVIAFFEKRPKELPKNLEIQIDGKRHSVPLVARVQEQFRPE
jgi:hypothetical protein